MSKDILVGSTGFVGTNLASRHAFEGLFHSTNISQAYDLKPDLCIYAGIPAAMYIANSDPEADLAIIVNAYENIKRIHPKKLVLISSIAVYDDSRGKNEDSYINSENLSTYGKNRLYLEQLVRNQYDDALIIRLPALYGKRLKKNFIFDLHTIIPSMLKQDKYDELTKESLIVKESYVLSDNGFFKMKPDANKNELKKWFENHDFNALSFTDSRSKFQFYNLKNLWKDICIALENDLNCLNITMPPVSAKEIYNAVTKKNGWNNVTNGVPFDYDLRSKHDSLFGGKNGYLYSKEYEVDDICRFMKEWDDETKYQ